MSKAYERPYPVRGRAWKAVPLASCALVLAACSGEGPKDTGGPDIDVCSREPTGEVPAGDANGDGAVDLADAVVILRHAADGGPAPVCADAVDLVDDDRVELDDAFSLLVHLYEGGFSLPDDPGCAASTLGAPTCGDIEVRVSAEGLVQVRPHDALVEGWSLSITADGCGLAATTAGTAAAAVVDDPPGRRDGGYDATFATDEGVVSSVVLGFMEPWALPTGEWSTILALTPVDACLCTVTIGDPLAAYGEPVESVLVAGGLAWPVASEGTIDVCGP